MTAMPRKRTSRYLQTKLIREKSTVNVKSHSPNIRNPGWWHCILSCGHEVDMLLREYEIPERLLCALCAEKLRSA